MKVSHLLVLGASGWALQSCLIYDGDLLGQGEANPSTGGTGNGGVVGGDGGTGGLTESGGSPSAGGTGSGGDPSGGMGGEGAGSGGSSDCDDEPSALPDKTAVDLIDTFDLNWPKLNNSTGAWNGNWTTNAKADSIEEANYTPQTTDENAWERGGYTSVSCDDSNLALRIMSTGSSLTPDGYGIGFDGALANPSADVDLTGYTGIVFNARSSNNTKLKIAFASAADPGTNIAEVNVPPLGANWGSPKEVLLPAAVSDAAIIKLVAQRIPDDGEDIDIWIDDIAFYTE